MNEPDVFPELSAVLERATDAVEPTDEPQHAATAALARARVVRTRRRGLVAGAVAAVAVLVVWMAVGLHGVDRADPPIAPSPTVPAIPAAAVQATWDPRTDVDLPQRDTVLPAVIDPPTGAPALPLSTAARLVLRDANDGLVLLGADGSWAAAKAPSGSAFNSVLSDDGTMLANLGAGGLFVTDVRDGDWRELELPSSPGPASYWTELGVTVQWEGNGRLLLHGHGSEVGVVDATGERPPGTDHYDTDDVQGLAPTPDGRLLVFGLGGKHQVIREVSEGSVLRSFRADALPAVHLPIATDERVVGVVNGIPQADRPTEHSGVLVLERDGYGASAYLPIAGTRFTAGIDATGFGAGDVSPLGWLDAQTVLLARVGSTGRPWSLVAWDVVSGELGLVSRGGTDTQPASVARDLVGE